MPPSAMRLKSFGEADPNRRNPWAGRAGSGGRRSEVVVGSRAGDRGRGSWPGIVAAVGPGVASRSELFLWVGRSERTQEELVRSDRPMVGLIGMEIQSPIRRVPPLS
jgi:hypothetical protein